VSKKKGAEPCGKKKFLLLGGENTRKLKGENSVKEQILPYFRQQMPGREKNFTPRAKKKKCSVKDNI